jgi:hypothetical protein
MDWKKTLLTSTEFWTGTGLLLAGLAALAAGMHGALAQALAPFGVGLILSDVLTKTAGAARERARVRVRRDD